MVSRALKSSLVQFNPSRGTVFLEHHYSQYYCLQYHKGRTYILHIGDFKSATKFYSSNVGRSWSKIV